MVSPPPAPSCPLSHPSSSCLSAAEPYPGLRQALSSEFASPWQLPPLSFPTLLPLAAAAKLAVDAVLRTKTLNLEQIQIIKMSGGSLKVSAHCLGAPARALSCLCCVLGMMSSRKENTSFPGRATMTPTISCGAAS